MTSLGEDFLSFREMLDCLGADFFEASRQTLAQDPRAGRRGVQPRNEDEVGPFFVEAQRLWDVVRGENHAGVRRVRVFMSRRLLVPLSTSSVMLETTSCACSTPA